MKFKRFYPVSKYFSDKENWAYRDLELLKFLERKDIKVFFITEGGNNLINWYTVFYEKKKLKGGKHNGNR